MTLEWGSFVCDGDILLTIFSESTDVPGFNAPWFFHLLSTPPDTKLSSGAPPPKKEPDSDSGALVYDVAPLSAAAAAGVKVGILVAIG